MQVTFVGGGNMASALIGGIVAAGGSADELTVVEPRADAAAGLAQRHGVRTYAAACEAAFHGDAVVIAVKPQAMREVAGQIASFVADTLVISVAAGIRATDLARWLGGHGRVVRTMPNTPALVGAGVTALAAPAGLGPDDRACADRILRAVGETVWVDDESLLDAVTAVSGSGPAYVFYAMEALHAAAREMGLPNEQARALVLATFDGAARLARASDEPPATLRERVTSPNGTTAAALAVLDERGVAAAMRDAARAARDRSIELGDEFGRG